MNLILIISVVWVLAALALGLLARGMGRVAARADAAVEAAAAAATDQAGRNQT